MNGDTTDFLAKENLEIAKMYITGKGYVRFWDENTVQLDGDYTVEDLKQVVKAMESFK